MPLVWRPLVERRTTPGIEPVQFALAGMNAHISHDLPIAVVATCTARASSPETAPHFADYQKVDKLLDAAEQSIRESFESAPQVAVDKHLSAVPRGGLTAARPRLITIGRCRNASRLVASRVNEL